MLGFERWLGTGRAGDGESVSWVKEGKGTEPQSGGAADELWGKRKAIWLAKSYPRKKRYLARHAAGATQAIAELTDRDRGAGGWCG